MDSYLTFTGFKYHIGPRPASVEKIMGRQMCCWTGKNVLGCGTWGQFGIDLKILRYVQHLSLIGIHVSLHSCPRIAQNFHKLHV